MLRFGGCSKLGRERGLVNRAKRVEDRCVVMEGLALGSRGWDLAPFGVLEGRVMGMVDSGGDMVRRRPDICEELSGTRVGKL